MKVKTIHKYQLKLTDKQDIMLPVGSTILSCQVQNDVICVWVIVEKELEACKSITFILSGTGCDIDHDNRTHVYINSVQMGQYVWHIFIEEYNKL